MLADVARVLADAADQHRVGDPARGAGGARGQRGAAGHHDAHGRRPGSFRAAAGRDRPARLRGGRRRVLPGGGLSGAGIIPIIGRSGNSAGTKISGCNRSRQPSYDSEYASPRLRRALHRCIPSPTGPIPSSSASPADPFSPTPVARFSPNASFGSPTVIPAGSLTAARPAVRRAADRRARLLLQALEGRVVPGHVHRHQRRRRRGRLAAAGHPRRQRRRRGRHHRVRRRLLRHAADHHA